MGGYVEKQKQLKEARQLREFYDPDNFRTFDGIGEDVSNFHLTPVEKYKFIANKVTSIWLVNFASMRVATAGEIGFRGSAETERVLSFLWGVQRYLLTGGLFERLGSIKTHEVFVGE